MRCATHRAQGAMPCTDIAVSRAYRTHITFKRTIDAIELSLLARSVRLEECQWRISVSDIKSHSVSFNRARFTFPYTFTRYNLSLAREWHIESNRALVLVLALAKAQSWAQLSHISALFLYPNIEITNTAHEIVFVEKYCKILTFQRSIIHIFKKLCASTKLHQVHSSMKICYVP